MPKKDVVVSQIPLLERENGQQIVRLRTAIARKIEQCAEAKLVYHPRSEKMKKLNREHRELNRQLKNILGVEKRKRKIRLRYERKFMRGHVPFPKSKPTDDYLALCQFYIVRKMNVPFESFYYLDKAIKRRHKLNDMMARASSLQRLNLLIELKYLFKRIEQSLASTQEGGKLEGFGSSRFREATPAVRIADIDKSFLS